LASKATGFDLNLDLQHQWPWPWKCWPIGHIRELRRVQSDVTELNCSGLDKLTNGQAVMHYSRHRLTTYVIRARIRVSQWPMGSRPARPSGRVLSHGAIQNTIGASLLDHNLVHVLSEIVWTLFVTHAQLKRPIVLLRRHGVSATRYLHHSRRNSMTIMLRMTVWMQTIADRSSPRAGDLSPNSTDNMTTTTTSRRQFKSNQEAQLSLGQPAVLFLSAGPWTAKAGPGATISQGPQTFLWAPLGRKFLIFFKWCTLVYLNIFEQQWDPQTSQGSG